ncbi:UDP-N-acetylglucosamine 2-epimerase (hydrolyzing) [Pelagibacterales bacterium SAG-MED10]|nr:UDP-N-acetylglucosamine 2-epimerase (hydrolyzing) [Pelagibacterales bacterium SAG-MED10]
MNNKIFKKKILFITGTRADFGKIKQVIKKLETLKFDLSIFITGMHLDKKFGSTFNEINKTFKKLKTKKFINSKKNDTMDIVLSKTINGFSAYVKKIKPDLIMVHGDRVEPLAASIVGTLNNILVGHIEGGERSGTIDEHLRHSISKLSHIHFVSNMNAKKRLILLGEQKEKVFITGSPDLDVMNDNNLPELSEIQNKYEFKFINYGILLYHPVTTELNNLGKETEILFKSIVKSKKKFLIIYPNNDNGHQVIINKIKKIFRKNNNIRVLRSMRFEYFLSSLKNSNVIIGNSSAGVREAPFYGIPTINIGSRQRNRYKSKSIHNVDIKSKTIEKKINRLFKIKYKRNFYFGKGNSANKIVSVLLKNNTWKTSIQKQLIY